MKKAFCLLIVVMSSLMGYADSLIIANAEKALAADVMSVTDKKKAAASGDKRDYYSQAPFHWADKSKDKGLPYISRDGMWNPEASSFDRTRLATMVKRVACMGQAYKETRDEKYAKGAILQLKTWFIDENTRMHPRMMYGQVIPGKDGDRGRRQGIIETYALTSIIKATKHLKNSNLYTVEIVRQPTVVQESK